MFFLNISKLGDQQQTLVNNFNNIVLLGHLKIKTWDPLTHRLANTLIGNINKTRELFNKFNFNRNKRGLLNGLGTLIKFITGNADDNDLNNINAHIQELQQTQNSEIQKVNKMVSLANHISQRLNTQTEVINKNFQLTQSHFESLETILDLRTLIISEIHETENMLDLLTKLERTISMSIHDIPNLEIINVDEILNVHNHLMKAYSPSQLLPFDETHLFKFIKSTKLVTVGTKDTITFLLKVPILNPYPSEYFHIYPIPNEDGVVLAPPKNHLIKTEELFLWTNEDCKTMNSVTLCVKVPTPDMCSFPNTSQCTFVKFRNDYQITIPLGNQQLLTASKNLFEVLEDCMGLLTRHLLKGANLISSPCTLIIGPKTYKNTSTLYEIPIPELPGTPPTANKEVDFQPQQLESPSTILFEATEIQQLAVHHDIIHPSLTGATFILLLCLVATAIAYRHRITSLLCHPRTIIHVSPAATPSTIREDPQV